MRSMPFGNLFNLFLKAKTPDLVDEYESFFEKEITSGYKKMITDKEAYLALCRHHSEYKNFFNIMKK